MIKKGQALYMKKHKTILLPLGRQFSIILVLFIVCTAGITLYNTQDYVRVQTDFLSSSLDSYSSQLAKNTLEAYDSYKNICYSVAYSSVVQDFLSSKNRQSSYEAYQELRTQLENTFLLNPYISDIAVYGQDGTFASLGGSAFSYKPFADKLEETSFPYCTVGTSLINGTNCHILAMPICTLGTGQSQRLGILFLAIDINHLLSNSMTNMNSQKLYEPEILFANAQQELIYGTRSLYRTVLSTPAPQSETDTYEVKANSSPVTYIAKCYSFRKLGLSLYVLVDKSQLTSQIQTISQRQFLATGAILLLVLLFVTFLYKPFLDSLKQLIDFMKSISAGNRKAIRKGAQIHQGLIGSTEINDIFNAFNEMLIKTEELNHTIFDSYTRMYELEANNRKTEIAFLRSQINPHFLYNTLTMICGMAAEGMTDKIILVTGALSQIFRYSIKGNDLVSLREELEIVKSYLMIQKERFADRFTIEYNFSDDAYDCLIPKMVIQPLVENAIVHGLEKSLKPGSILIGAGRNPRHGYLAIWIFDTGVGMPPEKLQELRHSIAASVHDKTEDASADLAKMDAQNHDSIGILNVNSRMVLYYGADYTLLIDSEEGVGTNIQLRVPYQTNDFHKHHNSSPLHQGI